MRALSTIFAYTDIDIMAIQIPGGKRNCSNGTLAK